MKRVENSVARIRFRTSLLFKPFPSIASFVIHHPPFRVKNNHSTNEFSVYPRTHGIWWLVIRSISKNNRNKPSTAPPTGELQCFFLWFCFCIQFPTLRRHSSIFTRARLKDWLKGVLERNPPPSSRLSFQIQVVCPFRLPRQCSFFVFL